MTSYKSLGTIIKQLGGRSNADKEISDFFSSFVQGTQTDIKQLAKIFKETNAGIVAADEYLEYYDFTHEQLNEILKGHAAASERWIDSNGNTERISGGIARHSTGAGLFIDNGFADAEEFYQYLLQDKEYISDEQIKNLHQNMLPNSDNRETTEAELAHIDEFKNLGGASDKIDTIDELDAVIGYFESQPYEASGQFPHRSDSAFLGNDISLRRKIDNIIITENTSTIVVDGKNLDANGNKIGDINQYYLDSGHADAQSFYNNQLINGFSVQDFDRLNGLAGASEEQVYELGQKYFAKLWEDGNADNALTFDEFSSLLKETESVIGDDVFLYF